MVGLLEWLAADQVLEKIYKPEKANDWSGILWHSNATAIPVDSPPCAWFDEQCDNDQNNQLLNIIIVSCVASVMSLLLAVNIILIARKYQFENALKEAVSMKVNWDDIKTNRENAQVCSCMSLRSNQTQHSGYRGQVFTDIGLYKDEVIAIKRLGIHSIDLQDRRIRVELKAMKDLKHENLNRFVGLCTESPNACILTMYATRGSLQDILNEESIKLTVDFKLSLVTDIANGMKYLHQSVIISHGRLSSHNCVVDNRWTCKITGYGFGYMRKLFSVNQEENENDQANFTKMVWIAPELLRIPNSYMDGTQKGDAYSFGIIIQELILEALPYSANDPYLRPKAIIQHVLTGIIPAFRPTIPDKACNDLWMTLMEKCWAEEPEQRPSFTQILSMIRDINGGETLRLADSLIQRLEVHTANLEDIVTERSEDLQMEKGKVELLLSELLPKTVADELKVGKQVAPEVFDTGTLFFSDICGFTRISAAGTPMQVVEMLNEMYTMFDAISAKFDVYKVATIGDAYVVCSGIPTRNGEKHAREIAYMALALLQSVMDFSIPHIPTEHLKLRIGLHTGPCVAAVVGRKMPRYLLFGDTVDIASMIESSGHPMKIHVSNTTNDLLKKDGSFIMEARGEQYIKGKGIICTHWVRGVKGSDFVLPSDKLG